MKKHLKLILFISILAVFLVSYLSTWFFGVGKLKSDHDVLINAVYAEDKKYYIKETENTKGPVKPFPSLKEYRKQYKIEYGVYFPFIIHYTFVKYEDRPAFSHKTFWYIVDYEDF